MTYTPTDNKLMRKLNESFDDIVDDDIIRTLLGKQTISENDVDNAEYKTALEKSFGSVVNCKKNFTYIDENNWVFTIVCEYGKRFSIE